MERTQIYMHSHLPEFSALLTVFAYLIINNVIRLFEFIQHPAIILQISMLGAFEVFLYGSIGATAGWMVKHILDTTIKLINKNKTK